MSFERTRWVWMNGRHVRWGAATVHVSAHALHYGSGVFEGVRCYATAKGPTLFRLDAHLERLYASAAVYGLAAPFGREELSRAVCETIQRNEFDACYVRLICYFGSGGLGLDTSRCPAELAVIAWPWGAYLGAEKLATGVKVTISSWTKFSPAMMPTTAKACGQYLNSMLATREALAHGCDEALLLDVGGRVAEGPGENLFIVRDGTVVTNDERSSILLGVTRDSVLRIAQDLGYRTEVGFISPADLRSCDEAFFTGTAVEVMPIAEVDGRPVGRGRPGPVTDGIQRAFFSAIKGEDARYRHWLHPVS
jgi:branched-chain amino acid aminotransferase